MLWCLGMYASGSTWVFNAAMKICAAVSPEVPVVGCYVTTLADLDLTEQQQRLGIVKTDQSDNRAEWADGPDLTPTWHESISSPGEPAGEAPAGAGDESEIDRFVREMKSKAK